MKRAQALNHIENRIADGQSKVQIFKELSGQVAFKDDLLSYLAEVPDNDIREKYQKINRLLFVLIILITIAKFIIGGIVLLKFKAEFLPWFLLGGFWLHIVSPFLLVFMAAMVFRFRGSVYRMFIVAGIAYLMLTLAVTREIMTWIILHIPALAAIIMAYYIGKNAFPYYKFWGNLDTEKFELSLNR